MKQILPENISTYGGEVDSLFFTITLFVVLAFAISIAALIIPLFRYRYKEGRKSSRIRGIGMKQMRWVFAGMLVMALCDFYMLYAEHSTWVKMEETLPEQEDFHVVITGRQWNWIFTYPGPDNKLYTADDVIVNRMNSSLHVPAGKNIIIDIKAIDVIHSVFFKNIRLKQDAIPGRTITRWFNVTKPGKYEIACAEICGVLHSKMRSYLVVQEEDEFNRFLSELYAEKQK